MVRLSLTHSYTIAGFVPNYDTHRLVVGAPLAVILAFCFGFILLQSRTTGQAASAVHEASVTSETQSPKKLPSPSLAAKAPLLPVNSSSSNTTISSSSTTTTGPQMTSVPPASLAASNNHLTGAPATLKITNNPPATMRLSVPPKTNPKAASTLLPLNFKLTLP